MPTQQFIKRKPAYNRLNLVGQRFGRLLVVEAAGLRLPKRFYWKCLCDCGKTCFVSTGSLDQREQKAADVSNSVLMAILILLSITSGGV